MIEKETIEAVLDEDLKRLLRDLGLLGRFERGELHCAFCKDMISWENLNALFPDSGSIKVSCTKATCVKALADRVSELSGRARA